MSRGQRLAKQDWLEAGKDVLRSEGATGLKLSALTSALDVTTGSFYHHFSDFGAYLDALADDYARASPRAAFAEIADRPPLERLQALLTMAAAQSIPALDRAMRVWAATNEHARAAVEALDAEILGYVRDVFTDLGFTEGEARARAHLTYAAGAAIIYPPWPRGAIDAGEVIRLLTQRPAPMR